MSQLRAQSHTTVCLLGSSLYCPGILGPRSWLPRTRGPFLPRFPTKAGKAGSPPPWPSLSLLEPGWCVWALGLLHEPRLARQHLPRDSWCPYSGTPGHCAWDLFVLSPRSLSGSNLGNSQSRPTLPPGSPGLLQNQLCVHFSL